MSTPTPEPAGASASPVGAGSDSGYLYHKERPQPVDRTGGRRATPRRKPGKRAGTKHHNVAHQALLANIRTFSVVAAFMGCLLGLAVYVSGKIWSSKQDRARRSIPEEKPLAQPEAPGADDADTVQLAIGTRTAAPELDIEALRKANYLAKRGQILENSGQYREATERYREALKVWPYLSDVWARLGKAYLKLEDYPRAQIALERAVESNPQTADILNDLGVSYLYQQQTETAARLFETAAEIDPTFSPTYLNMARCHLAEGRREEARDMLGRYLTQRSDDPEALREMAILDAEAGDFDNALSHLRRALIQEPEWPLLYFDAAAASALLGRAEDAVRYLEKAIPLVTPTEVYRVYKEPAFQEVRVTELGKLFEGELVDRARELLSKPPPRTEGT